MAKEKQKEKEATEERKQRELYHFNVYTEQEVEKKVEKEDEETGKKTTETQKVKEKVPTRIVISRPTRKQIDEADLQFAIKQSEYIKKGILTRAMITKKYADTGGALSEEEAKMLDKKYRQLAEKQNRFVHLTVNIKKQTKEQKEETQQLLEDLNTLRREIAEVESSYSNLFQHTADVKANNWVILWYSLMLTYIEDEETGEWTPFFDGESFEEKTDSYYDFEEEASEFYIEVRRKLAYFISFWYYGSAHTQEDFEKIEKDIEDDVI